MVSQNGDFAIVVGIQHYPEFRSLQGPVDDAKTFAHWLREDPDGGGLPIENCELIVSASARPPVPVKTQIDDAVARIRKALKNDARRFYFYFSGHGMSTDELDLALCVANWSRDRAGAALSYVKYRDLFLALGHFQEVTFFLDCCRVREIAVSGLPPENSVIRPGARAGEASMWTAFATEFGNAAYEAKIAEEEALNRIPEPRGHFTEALMEGLRGGAAGPGNGVTAGRLESYLKKRTREIAAKHGHDQKARVLLDVRDGAEIIFGNFPALSEVEIEFVPPRPNVVTLFGPDGQEIKQGTADSGPWRTRLMAGVHWLQDGNISKDFRAGGVRGVQHVEF